MGMGENTYTRISIAAPPQRREYLGRNEQGRRWTRAINLAAYLHRVKNRIRTSRQRRLLARSPARAAESMTIGRLRR